MRETSRSGSGLTRRGFLRATGALAAGAMGAASLSACSAAQAELAQTGGEEEQVFCGICRSNCFQGCHLNGYVRDGKLMKTMRGDAPDEIYSGICLKGLTLTQRTYSGTRIKYPMRRVEGTERGAGQWERISWDEAIDEVVTRFKAIQEQYGPRAIAFDSGSGCVGLINGMQVISRVANLMEATHISMSYDLAVGYGTNRVTGGGDWLFCNELVDVLNSKTVFVWGANPVFSQPQSWRILARARKENGVKLVCIDPNFSATAARCDEYIHINPGTDSRLLLTMMNLCIQNGWIDEEFLRDRSSAPFLVRRDNGKILRKSDFEEGGAEEEEEVWLISGNGSLYKAASGSNDKYYVWDAAAQAAAFADEAADAALEGSYVVNGVEVDTVLTLFKKHLEQYDVASCVEITSVPEETILSLTERYATQGPSWIYSVYGCDHYQNGHLFGASLSTLGALTGNLGKHGASISGHWSASNVLNQAGSAKPTESSSYSRIPACHFHNVVRDQALEGEPYPVKAFVVTYGNPMSNYAQQSQWYDEILPNIDFVLAVDTELTDSALHADLVLPAAFWFEVNDMVQNYFSPYLFYQEKAIEPLRESKPDSEIWRLIAEGMGFGEYFPENDDDKFAIWFDKEGLAEKGITYENLKAQKVLRVASESVENPYVFGEDGFPTASGRAELYYENPEPRLDYGQDVSEYVELERFPYWSEPGEVGMNNPLREKYPIVCLQEHSRFRVHSQWFNVPLLRELDPEPLVNLSRPDAEERGIANGDVVEVFNDRGHLVAKAVINDGFSKGMMTTPKGWQREQCIDGCFQELTSHEAHPMNQNYAYFDTLVDVRKL